MGRWDKEGIDPVRQAELAKEARERGLPEYVVEASRAVPDSLVRDLVNDFRRGPSLPSSMAQKGPAPEVKRGTGWQADVPLRQPPGVDLIDRMVKGQDQLDQLERIQQLKNTLELLALSQRSEKM